MWQVGERTLAYFQCNNLLLPRKCCHLHFRGVVVSEERCFLYFGNISKLQQKLKAEKPDRTASRQDVLGPCPGISRACCLKRQALNY